MWHPTSPITTSQQCSPVPQRFPLSSPRSNHPRLSDSMLWLSPLQLAPDWDLCKSWIGCSVHAGLKPHSSQQDRQKSRSVPADTITLKVTDHACSFMLDLMIAWGGLENSMVQLSTSITAWSKAGLFPCTIKCRFKAIHPALAISTRGYCLECFK